MLNEPISRIWIQRKWSVTEKCIKKAAVYTIKYRAAKRKDTIFHLAASRIELGCMCYAK